MHYIYVDEAGTSANEPVSVVVGLIVEADAQLKQVEAITEDLVKKIAEPLPQNVRSSFIFHATDIWNGRKYTNWSLKDRLEILCALMALPRLLDIPICMAKVRRDSAPIEAIGSFPQFKFHHIMAFNQCLVRADGYIQTYSSPNETGVVIAEDVPELKKLLSQGAQAYKNEPYIVPPHYMRPTEAELTTGVISQDAVLSSSRVQDDIIFVKKGVAPLLQIADACAFGFRRYFANQSYGEDFIMAMLNKPLNRWDWEGPMSAFSFHSKPKVLSTIPIASI